MQQISEPPIEEMKRLTIIQRKEHTPPHKEEKKDASENSNMLNPPSPFGNIQKSAPKFYLHDSKNKLLAFASHVGRSPSVALKHHHSIRERSLLQGDLNQETPVEPLSAKRTMKFQKSSFNDMSSEAVREVTDIKSPELPKSSLSKWCSLGKFNFSEEILEYIHFKNRSTRKITGLLVCLHAIFSTILGIEELKIHNILIQIIAKIVLIAMLLIFFCLEKSIETIPSTSKSRKTYINFSNWLFRIMACYGILMYMFIHQIEIMVDESPQELEMIFRKFFYFSLDTILFYVFMVNFL